MKRIALFLVLTLLLTISFAVKAQAEVQSYIIIANGNNLPRNLAAQVASANGRIDERYPFGMAVASSRNPNFASRINGVMAVVPNYELIYRRPTTFTLEMGAHPIVDVSSGNVEASIEYDNANGNIQDAIVSEGIAVWPFTNEYEVLQHDYTSLLWGLDAVNAPESWDDGNRGAGVVVAVLDGGFVLDHPDFPAYTLPVSFVPYESVIYDFSLDPDGFSHGSHVAGIIAAPDNGFGITGVAPDVTIMPVKVLTDYSSGAFSWVISGIYYAAINDADIINMSLGVGIPQAYRDGSGNFAHEIAALRVAMSKAVRFAYNQGTTVIVAAGNEGRNLDADKDMIMIPADMPHAISISALGPEGWAFDPTTNLDTLAIYSNYGRSGIDFGAPGGDYEFFLQDQDAALSACVVERTVDLCIYFDFVLSLNWYGYEWAAGTSMAAPHASGIAALIIAQNGGSMRPARVKTQMQRLADDLGQPGHDPIYGAGRVSSGN